jgi:hypothetical protein
VPIRIVGLRFLIVELRETLELGKDLFHGSYASVGALVIDKL